MNKLDKNENSFGHSPAVKRALKQPPTLCELSYYPPEENSDIYDKLAKFLNVKSSNLYIGNGLESILLTTWKNIRLSGTNNLILPESCWAYYYNLANQSFFNPKSISTYSVPPQNDTYSSNLESLSSILQKTNQPSLVIVTNPNNPTGHETSIDELIPLIKNYPNTIFLIDEAYVGFGTEDYQKTSTIKLVSKFQNIILGRSFSKFFGCPGLRAGYIIANEKLIESLRLKPYYLGIRSTTTRIINSLIDSYDFYLTQATKIKESRDNFIKQINKNSIFTAFKSYSNCILLKVNQDYDPTKLQNYLQKNNFTIKIFIDKPHQNYLRISVAQKSTMNQLSALLNRFFEK